MLAASCQGDQSTCITVLGHLCCINSTSDRILLLCRGSVAVTLHGFSFYAFLYLSLLADKVHLLLSYRKGFHIVHSYGLHQLGAWST